MKPIAPHGGKLVNRLRSAESVAARAEGLERITLDARELAFLELIAVGAVSPLTGFLQEHDYTSVVASMRLADGSVWPVPLTLAVLQAPKGSQVALVDAAGHLWAVMAVSSVYSRDPQLEAREVYGTDDSANPGAAYLLSRPRTLIGGDVDVAPLPDLPFAKYRLTPHEMRVQLSSRGWQRVAGFQTHTAIHRAEEYVTKLALEVSDGLVIHALVAETQHDDVPASVRFEIDEALLKKYYPAERVLLAALPGVMPYGGPKEALFHALVAKNYGITSVMVVGDQSAHESFAGLDIGVTALKFEPAFFCSVCEHVASSKTCPHGAESRLELSGTKMRELLRSGQPLPHAFTRPEVADVLRRHFSGGYIVWFTGLSGVGKTTLAQAVVEHLRGGRPIELLDGDEIRTYLSKGLGFSKEDRNTNTRRIGFVARALARNGVIAVVATISPYADTRNEVRELAARDGVDFIEIHVDALLETLIERDTKGLYKRALAGELPHLTGVSDPYEVPVNPDLRLPTHEETQATSVQRVLELLKKRGLLH